MTRSEKLCLKSQIKTLQNLLKVKRAWKYWCKMSFHQILIFWIPLHPFILHSGVGTQFDPMQTANVKKLKIEPNVGKNLASNWIFSILLPPSPYFGMKLIHMID